MARSLRPARADDLGLRRALSDRLLPLLVAAMTFLAALTMAGAMAAAGLAQHWRGGAATLMTVQVPTPSGDVPGNPPGGGTRFDAVARTLAATKGVADARPLSADEVNALLKPWLGVDAAALSLRLPAVFEVRVDPAAPPDAAALDASLAQAAPGTLVERSFEWLSRLTSLAASLQACAALALLVVAFVAGAVVAVATRAGLAARRDAIEIVHGLGATDRMIAGQFSARITRLTLTGGVLGLVLVLPVVLGLAQLSAPFQNGETPALTPAALLAALPPLLWAALAALPVAASAIGWGTAQATVRGWLGRLP
jgi:cell division transport system permease protein